MAHITTDMLPIWPKPSDHGSGLKDYKLLNMVGQGWMINPGVYGRVWRAKCTLDDQMYAVKEVPIDSEGVLPTTYREIAMLRRLNDHPNILKYLI
jgi:serine/threonine protein kinase